MQAACKNQEKILSPKELEGYRQWLAELSAEAGAPGGDLGHIDEALFPCFAPKRPVGRQVYRSFSDEELLEPVLRTMDHPGHKPRLDQVYCVYCWYLKERFGTVRDVCWKARARWKQRRDEVNWPADWPERVAPQELIAYCGGRNYAPTQAELQTLEEFCARIRRRRCPLPEDQAPAEFRQLLARAGCTWDRGMRLLGVPVLRKEALRHMKKYWAAQRRDMALPAPDSEQEANYECEA